MGLDLPVYAMALFVSAENIFQDVPVSEENTQLTTQLLVENVYEDKLSQPDVDLDPYEDKTPVDMLTRQYLIRTITLASASLTTFYPAADLISVPTIQKYLQRFKFLRAGIKLTFLLVSNQMQYGAVGISFLPYTVSTALWSSEQQRSQAELHLLDISEQEAFEMELPYFSPLNYWDLGTFTDPGWAVTVEGLLLNTITTTAPNTIKMQVFASFVEPEAAGYLPEPAAVFQMFAGTRAGIAATGRVVRNVAGGFLDHAGATAGLAFQAGRVASDVNNAVNLGNRLMGTAPSAPATSAKLEVCPDLSSPSRGVQFSTLGDMGTHGLVAAPSIRNIYSIREMCSVPTYLRSNFITDDTVVNFSADPFVPGSYAKYVSKMYKYWRGSTRILLRFVTSPLVSGRFKVTLFPASTSSASPYIEGDLPSWIVTVRGSTSWSLEIPYLQRKPWLPTTDFGFLPTVRVQLLDTLPQPYDKPVGIYILSYVGTGQDFEFAGLESFVPADLAPEAVFQCTPGQMMMENLTVIGGTSRFPFQGGNDDIRSAIVRFSSRDPIISNLVPFPIKIENDPYSYDNFDYVCNMYKFWTGQTNVRYLYSEALSDSLLRVSVSNSKNVVGGQDWKTGNSMAVTDQHVWPMLEFTYPFLNEIEFDSIWEPNGMYPQLVDAPESVSAMFISAGADFQLFYLLPAPDLPYAEPVFQSRYADSTVIQGSMTAASSSMASQEIIEEFDFSKSYSFELDIIPQSSTAISWYAALGITGGIPNPVSGTGLNPAPNAFTGRLWVTNGTEVKKEQLSGSFSGLFGGVTRELVLYCYNPTGGSVNFNWLLRVTALSGAVMLSNPQYPTSTLGAVSAVVTDITGSSVTLDTAVLNTPNVLIDAQPVEVTLSGSLPVIIDGVVQVEGAVSQTTPVWTTLYKPG
jgi:hypothetical protein